MGELITFHKLLESTMQAKGATVESLAYGLCAESTMYSIIRGERLPDFRLRNRLLERLGVSSVGFEDFVTYQEYVRWEKESKLISIIEERNVAAAQEIFNSIKESLKTCNRIERQILLDIEAKIGELNGEKKEKIMHLYKKAVNLTMPNLNLSNLSEKYLSSYEYYLILRLKNFEAGLSSEIELQIEGYRGLMKSITNSELDEAEKSKVFSMAVCGYYNLIKNLICTRPDLANDIFERCLLAEEMLKNSYRMYFLVELLQIKIDIYPKVEKKLRNCDDNIRHAKILLTILNSLYGKYKVDSSMEYSRYIYEGACVYSINDVISRRRRLLGMTRKELSEGICSERTLLRIENCQANPQRPIAYRLLEKMGISGAYRKFQVQTDSYQTILQHKVFCRVLNDGNNERTEVLLRELEKTLDMSIRENIQAISFFNNTIRYKGKKETYKSFKENMEKILELTLPQYDVSKPEGYITKTEMEIMHNLSMYDGKNMYSTFLIKKSDYWKSEEPNGTIGHRELVMGTYASKLGDVGDYEMSNKILEEIIIDALRNRRTHPLHMNIYNIIWNKAMNENLYFSEESKRGLLICKEICSYCNDATNYQFYESCYNKIDNKINWTC